MSTSSGPRPQAVEDRPPRAQADIWCAAICTMSPPAGATLRSPSVAHCRQWETEGGAAGCPPLPLPGPPPPLPGAPRASRRLSRHPGVGGGRSPGPPGGRFHPGPHDEEAIAPPGRRPFARPQGRRGSAAMGRPHPFPRAGRPWEQVGTGARIDRTGRGVACVNYLRLPGTGARWTVQINIGALCLMRDRSPLRACGAFPSAIPASSPWACVWRWNAPGRHTAWVAAVPGTRR